MQPPKKFYVWKKTTSTVWKKTLSAHCLEVCVWNTMSGGKPFSGQMSGSMCLEVCSPPQVHSPRTNSFHYHTWGQVETTHNSVMGNATPPAVIFGVLLILKRVNNDGISLAMKDIITVNECQNFPGNKIPGQKISRQNIAGWKILGPENSGNTKFSWNSRKKIRENSRIFSLEGRKFQDFWLHLIPGLKIL